MTATRVNEVTPRDMRRQCWTETSAPGLEGRLATQYAVANGYLGVRGTHEELPSWASPGFFVAGTYCAAPRELIPIHSPDHILTHPERVKPEHHAAYTELTTMPNLPNPVAVRLAVGGTAIHLDDVAILACERVLDMERACLTRRLVVRDAAGRRTVVDSERFASWANPHLLCFRYQVTADDYTDEIAVVPTIVETVTNVRGIRLFTVTDSRQAPGLNRVTVRIEQPEQTLTIAQAYTVRSDGRVVTLDVAVGVGDDAEEADAIARAACAAGYDAALAAHLQAVERARERGEVWLDADVLTAQGYRFGQLHLESALCPDNPRVSVPIKGLTGEGYRFMTFWDTDFHMFPYYLLTNPAQAKNLILYRYGQLDAYRRFAQSQGYRGAQVPWQTATTGGEETAPWLNLSERELHISADVAYAVQRYDALADDPDLLLTAGAEIVFETARFYASRVTRNRDTRRYELRGVGCPDQYHTWADNNVFISLMARWNLRYAGELAADPRLRAVRERIGLTAAEVRKFRTVAAEMYIIPPDNDGIIEEFDGFFGRSPDLRGVSEWYCEHTQAVKQPDVVAAFLPFADEYPQTVQRANWHYYAARTLHGSSLSLPGMALAGAMCGLADEAADYFLRAARMDLDDLNQNTHLGVHLAGYAVLWETVVFGFGGLHASRAGLVFQPRLPRRWGGLSFTITWHGCRLQVQCTRGSLCLIAADDNPRAIPVRVREQEGLVAPGQEATFTIG